jgi:hypothetical protein
MNSRYFFSLLILLTLLQNPSPAPASDIYLKVDDNEFGQGILRPRGNECLIITPAHVVENGFTIEATTAEQIHSPAELLELFPGDISVLRLKTDVPISCRRPSWPDHRTLNRLLATEKEGELQTMLADGSIRKTPVKIVGYDQYRNISIRPLNAEDALAKGFSGSPLFIGGQCAGMLLSIDNGLGRCIRQDALVNTLALFFADTGPSPGQPSQPPQQPAHTASSPPTKPETLHFSNTLLNHVTKEHHLQLNQNSPIHIALLPTGDQVRYAIELVDSSHRISCSYSLKSTLDHEITVPCTPLATDTFVLRVIGTGGEGRYNLRISPLVSDTNLRSADNILQVDGESQSGTIAKAAVAEYRVKLFANSPVRLVQQPTGEGFGYQLELTDSRGKTVLRLPSVAKPDQAGLRIPWTPPGTDTYTLQIRGKEGVGPYAIALEAIAFDAQLRGRANVLQQGGRAMGGAIATGAVAEYRFSAEAYTPMRFNFAATDGQDGHFTVEVWDSEGMLIFRDPHRHFSGRESAVLPFTVSKAGAYILRLIGLDGETGYTISLSAP